HCGAPRRKPEEATPLRFVLVGKEGEHLDHFRVLERGTLEKVAPSLPFDVGAELDVKLGEVGLHDPAAGAGKVGNVDVIVAGAAKLVGKKVKVRVDAVTYGTAWAELLVPSAEFDEPLTAEAEAEKPTRARRAPTRKKTDEAEAPLDEAPAPAVEEEETTEEGEPAVAPVKKKTRRGTRGGRNRRKKT